MSRVEAKTTAALDRIGWELLNGMADDCENLEQLYRGVCYEMMPMPDGTGHDYRPLPNAPHLWEVVEHLRALVEQGLIAPVMDEDGHAWTPMHDLSMLWRAWFDMTPQGRAAWESAPGLGENG